MGLPQVGDPQAWFALNACYAIAVWGLYAWDLRVVQKQRHDFTTDDERLLHEDIVRDQRENIAVLMPLAVAFQGVSWWLVRRYPDDMLRGHWHLLLIGLTILFSLHYLAGGVRILKRRRAWILSRQAQERIED